MQKKIFLIAFSFLFVLSACFLPEKNDPFAEVAEANIETISGEVFPFSVSVSTSATHRLEHANKLVALMASDIVQLEQFEGRKVEVDGFYKKEKMRPIFWVESIRVKDLLKNEENLASRFETKKYSFSVPGSWESSVLEDGTVHFLEKNDLERKIFLTFSVKDVEPKDKKNDPNIVIANMTGHTDSQTFESGQTRQSVTLFSNIFPSKKYVFVFNNQPEKSTRKKEFFESLNSFIEGEGNVKLAHDAELKRLAEIEAAKIKENTNNDLELVNKEDKKETKDIISIIFGGKDRESVTEVEGKEEIPAKNKPEDTELPDEFNNLIDSRSFHYASNYYKFSMDVPYGLWFRNFGPSASSVTEVGFATYDLGSKLGAEIMLKIISSDAPPLEAIEVNINGQFSIKFPRNSNSYYELTGPSKYYDYMKSIQQSLKTL